MGASHLFSSKESEGHQPISRESELSRVYFMLPNKGPGEGPTSLIVVGGYFLLFLGFWGQNWVPRSPGPSQKLSQIKLCRFPNGELLASRWCRNRLFRSRTRVGDAKRWFCVACGGGHAPPPQRRKNEGLRNADPVYAVLGLCVLGMGVLAPPWLRRKTMVLCRGLRGAGLPLPKTRSDPRTLRYMNPL